MSATTLISVEEYLRTTYRPDCDYVDGQVVERNVGESEHSELQAWLAHWLLSRRDQWGISVYTEQRIRVAATRVRLPDVCVMTGPKSKERVFTRPPHVCIDILSRDDSIAGMLDRINDYTAFGVRHIWLIDPRGRRVWAVTEGRLSECEDLVLRASQPDVTVPLGEVFAEIDRQAAE
jgi:Uma2 family endonuclease